MMKLAEALILRADVQKRIEQVKQRLLRVVKVQEGENPAEDPQVLMSQLEQLYVQLTDLVRRINRTNVETAFDSEMTMADALAVRDHLGGRQVVYREVAQMATVVYERFMRSEIRYETTVDVAMIQRQADELAVERRELDTRIQELNWTTDLVE
jgi:hypothetical protein